MATENIFITIIMCQKCFMYFAFISTVSLHNNFWNKYSEGPVSKYKEAEV